MASRLIAAGDILTSLRGHFFKLDAFSPAFFTTGGASVSVKAGTEVVVAGALHQYLVDTPVVMPALTAGTDYAIYATVSGTLVASPNFSSPPDGYLATDVRQIGGFHFAPGGNAAAQNGGDAAPAINPYSIWDAKFRPACADPRGMALVAGAFWCDIYFMGVNHHTDGTSKAGATIADGSSPPKVPVAFGGNGVAAYGNFTWYVAREVARAYGKDLLDYGEFAAAAYGVKEAASRGNDPVTTGLATTNAGSSNADHLFTSKWGIIQAAGVQWSWGRDLGQRITGADYAAATAYTWKANTGGRGSLYTQGSDGISVSLLGGNCGDGSSCGSRASYWVNAPWNSNGVIGARARCDHLIHA